MKRYVVFAFLALATTGFVACGDNNGTNAANADSTNINSDRVDTSMNNTNTDTSQMQTDTSKNPNSNQDSMRQRY